MKGNSLCKTSFVQRVAEIRKLERKDFVFKCPVDFTLNLENKFGSDD